MQCFGYCIVDTETAVRQQMLRNDVGYREPEDFKLEVVK